MDDNVADTTKDINQEEKKSTTLDLTGLQHNDEETLMSEAIEKVNQVENIEQLEKIDKLTNQKTQVENANKNIMKEDLTNKEKENRTEIEEKQEKPQGKDVYIPQKGSTQPVESHIEPIVTNPKVQKTEIKIEHNAQNETKQKEKMKNKELTEEDIVLEMSGGIVEKKKNIPKIKISIPKFDKSKKVIYLSIVGLIILTAIISIIIFIVIPNVKTRLANKKIDDETITKPKPKEKSETIREQVDKDKISNILLESSNSSILKDVLLDIQKYPISDINKELEAIQEEQSIQKQTQ